MGYRWRALGASPRFGLERWSSVPRVGHCGALWQGLVFSGQVAGWWVWGAWLRLDLGVAEPGNFGGNGRPGADLGAEMGRLGRVVGNLGVAWGSNWGAGGAARGKERTKFPPLARRFIHFGARYARGAPPPC